MDVHSVIIAQQEELDEIYREFAKDMEIYLRTMRANVANVQNIVSDLRNSWVSENYNAFRHSMDSSMGNITEGLDRGENLKKIMLETERELAEALAKLKQKYGR